MLLKVLCLFLTTIPNIRISQGYEIAQFDVNTKPEPLDTTTPKTTTTSTPPPTTTLPDPPPKKEAARMARYIVHYSDWCVLAHISHHGNTTGYPAARVFSTADGWYNSSTGVLYFYVSKMDAHINDLSKDGRCSVTISLAEGTYCRKNNLDPEDPRCAQVILTGHFIFLDPNDHEWYLGRLYILERHPVIKTWPKSHDWNVAKLKIGHIQVADDFGGSLYPSVEEYFSVDP